MAIGGQQDRISVRRRFRDRIGAEIAPGARPIFDDDRLLEEFGQPLADQPRDGVHRAARRERNDDADRAGWIGLSPAFAGQGGERPERERRQKDAPHNLVSSLLHFLVAENHRRRHAASRVSFSSITPRLSSQISG